MKLWCHLSKLRSTGKLLPPTETVAGGRWWREWIVSSSLGAAKDFHCPSCLAAIFTAPRTYLVSTQAAFAGKDQCAETADHGQERIRQSSCEVKNLLQRPVMQLKSNFSNISIFCIYWRNNDSLRGGGGEWNNPIESAVTKACLAPREAEFWKFRNLYGVPHAQR